MLRFSFLHLNAVAHIHPCLDYQFPPPLFQANNFCNKESNIGFHWCLDMVSLSSSEWNILNSGLSGNKSWITTTAMKVPIQQCHCSWVYSSLQLVPLFRNIKIHGSTLPAISSDWNKCGTSLHRLHQPLPRLWICGWSEKNTFVFVWELQEVNAHRGFTVGHLPLVNLQKSGTRSPQIQKCRHSSRTQCAPNEQTNSGRLFVAPSKVVSAFLLSACDPLSWMAKTYTVWTKQYWGST